MSEQRAQALRESADSLRDVAPPIRRFRVHGFCFIPAEAQIVIEARDEQHALELAQVEWRANKRNLIVGNSEDESSAFDWQPTAEEINHPNP